MDKHEAHSVLRQHFMPYVAQSYQQLRSLIGGEHVSKIRGPSGTEYYFEVYASLVSEEADDVEVEGIVTEVNGRRWLPPMVAESFVVSAGGEKYSRCPGLLAGAAPIGGSATSVVSATTNRPPPVG